MTAIKSQLGRLILISCMALLSGRETVWASDDQLSPPAQRRKVRFPYTCPRISPTPTA